MNGIEFILVDSLKKLDQHCDEWLDFLAKDREIQATFWQNPRVLQLACTDKISPFSITIFQYIWKWKIRTKKINDVAVAITSLKC